MTQPRFNDQVAKLAEWIASRLPTPWQVSVEEVNEVSGLPDVSWKASERIQGAHLVIEDSTSWTEKEVTGGKVDKIHPFDEAYLFPKHGSYRFDYEPIRHKESPLLVHVGEDFLGIMLPQYRDMRARLPEGVSGLCWGWLPACEPYNITRQICKLTACWEISSAEQYAYHILIQSERHPAFFWIDSVLKAYPEIDTVCVSSPGRVRIFNRPPRLLTIDESEAKEAQIRPRLEHAERLKRAERYDEALEVYGNVIELDPANKAAIEGAGDCYLMLQPEPVAQYMQPEPGNPQFEKVRERIRKAETPWERRRAELALCELGVRYTWEQLKPQESYYRKKAEEIVSRAIDGSRSRPPQEVFEEARKKLLELQPEGDIGWTWFGFTIIGDALEKLREALKL